MLDGATLKGIRMKDKFKNLAELKKDLNASAVNFSKLLSEYYLLKDDLEGRGDRELDPSETSKIVSEVLTTMADGMGALIAMSGGDMTDGNMIAVGRDRSSTYNMVQLALYMREVSVRILEDVKKSLPPELARRIDEAMDMASAVGRSDDAEVPKVQA